MVGGGLLRSDKYHLKKSCQDGFHLRNEKGHSRFALRPKQVKIVMYASFFNNVFIQLRNRAEVKIAERVKLKRKSYFVDERALSRAKKALGVKTAQEKGISPIF